MSSEPTTVESEPQPFVPGPNAVDISPEKNGGIFKTIIELGENDEKPKNGDRVFVHYTGKLLDGSKFDSSVDRGEEFEFTLGKGEVIKAWDIGVATMKKGEKCTLVCHPDFAYGKSGMKPKIPENATLIFDIELIKWQMEDLTSEKDGGVLRSIIQEGEGYVTPAEGAIVDVHLIGTCAGTVFEERSMKFFLGEGLEVGVVEGIEVAVKKFRKGEKSKIYLTPKYAFGAEGSAKLNVPPNSSVEYEVTLNAFEKQKESWNMTPEEKLEQSDIAKNKGTNFFKEEKYEIAEKHYKKIISYLQGESELEGESKEKKNALLLAGHLNLAACYLKLENYPEAIQHCDKALEINPESTKGLFRKGQALMTFKEYEAARDLFNRVLEVDGTNKAVQKNIQVCNYHIKKQLQKDKTFCQNIFKKMAEESKEEPSKDKVITQENGHLEKMETDDEKQAAAESVQL